MELHRVTKVVVSKGADGRYHMDVWGRCPTDPSVEVSPVKECHYGQRLARAVREDPEDPKSHVTQLSAHWTIHEHYEYYEVWFVELNRVATSSSELDYELTRSLFGVATHFDVMRGKLHRS